jgi:hypothetical protein
MSETMMAPASDDVGIDVSRYVRYLLRHWIVIVGVTLLGGAVGWAIARLQTPMYLGVARLTVMQAGSGTAADAVVKYQAALQQANVLAAAIAKEPAAASVTTDALRTALSWRLGFPPNEFLVEVRWPDAALATRLARSVASQALETARQEHVEELSKTRDILRPENEAADPVQLKAKADLAVFRAANAKVLAALLPDEQRVELAYLDQEIPAERKRLADAEADLAKLTEPAAMRQDLLKRASELRTRLAGLEAKRDQFASDLAAIRTYQKVALIDTLQIIDAPLTPGRSLTSRTSGLPRGLATGLVLSIFGVLFYRGFWPR